MRLSLLLAMAALAIPSAAWADRHDGLLLRVTPGIAGAGATADVDDRDASIRGAAGRLGVTAGWAVVPRVILTVELLGHAVLGPDLEVDGDVTETDDDVSWGVSYAGLGVDFYTRNNFHIAGSGGPLIMTLDSDEIDRAETDVGGGGKLAAGYEWWAGPEVGLGVTLELLAGAVPDGDTTWGVGTLGLAFSATYN
ncbi:MAG TPA: hypothetical protein VKB80_28930 [Kofleriaceae bacterium]|nr:hypothetical protein [Kofleriaceae bacterium]